RRIEHRLGTVEAERLLRSVEVVNRDAVEVPAVRLGDPVELVLGLGERDQQRLLASCNAVQKELQAEGGLAATGMSDHQVGPAPREATPQDIVQACDARLCEL